MKTDVEIANGLKLAPKIVQVCVLDRATPYTDGFPPQSAVELLAWLNNHIASVPMECRPSLVVEFGVTSDYGGDVNCCSVQYERLETADEFAERAAKQVAAARATLLQQERNERRQLAALKAKYEPNN